MNHRDRVRPTWSHYRLLDHTVQAGKGRRKKKCTIIPETEEVRAVWKKRGEGRERSRTCHRRRHTDENGSARRNSIAGRNCSREGDKTVRVRQTKVFFFFLIPSSSFKSPHFSKEVFKTQFFSQYQTHISARPVIKRLAQRPWSYVPTSKSWVCSCRTPPAILTVSQLRTMAVDHGIIRFYVAARELGYISLKSHLLMTLPPKLNRDTSSENKIKRMHDQVSEK